LGEGYHFAAHCLLLPRAASRIFDSLEEIEKVFGRSIRSDAIERDILTSTQQTELQQVVMKSHESKLCGVNFIG